MPTTAAVMKSHRTKQDLTLRKFADMINQHLINTDVTYATIHRWEDETKQYEPDMRLLFECVATYRDWRAEWAVDCLKSMWPDLFNSGVIQFNLPKAEK